MGEFAGSFSAIVFDCDGVIIDSEPVANRVLAEQLGLDFGYEIAAEESHRRFTGMVIRDILKEIEKETGVSAPYGWSMQLWERTREAFETELQPIPGTQNLMDRLDKANLPWGIASQSHLPYLEHALGLVGVWERATGRIASAKEVANPKPAPDVYLLAFERVGCEPASTIIIEDSPTGTRAGVAAGARVIGFANDRPARELLYAGAVAAFETMAEIQQALGL